MGPGMTPPASCSMIFPLWILRLTCPPRPQRSGIGIQTLARAEQRVGKSLDAEITLYSGDAALESLAAEFDLAAICNVSGAKVVMGQGEGFVGETGVAVEVTPSEAPKCSRCWTHSPAVDEESELCPRCAAVLKKITL